MGGAYYCFCSKNVLLRERKVEKEGLVYRYDRFCRDLDKREAERRLAAGEPFVIRQRMPDSGSTSFEDAVYGTITVDNSELEDQVLIKSDTCRPTTSPMSWISPMRHNTCRQGE